MSTVSLPVTRPNGRALLVGTADCRTRPLAVLREMGINCVEFDDPYSAALELVRRTNLYGAVVLSLQGLYCEELSFITTIRNRYSSVEIWLTDTDGRQATLAEAMGLGADGLLGEDGLHRLALAAPQPAARVEKPSSRHPVKMSHEKCQTESPANSPRVARSNGARRSTRASRSVRGDREPRRDQSAGSIEGSFDGVDCSIHDPVLTAEELRALLHENPVAPSANDSEH